MSQTSVLWGTAGETGFGSRELGVVLGEAEVEAHGRGLGEQAKG